MALTQHCLRHRPATQDIKQGHGGVFLAYVAWPGDRRIKETEFQQVTGQRELSSNCKGFIRKHYTARR